MKNLVLEWFWECEEENAATEGGFKQRNKQQRIVVVGSHGQCQRWGGGVVVFFLLPWLDRWFRFAKPFGER